MASNNYPSSGRMVPACAISGKMQTPETTCTSLAGEIVRLLSARRKAMIVISTPLVGKTTLVKEINQLTASAGGIAVDLDYRGPKRCPPETSKAHSELANSWIRSGVKLITGFQGTFDVDTIDADLADVYVVIPRPELGFDSTEAMCRALERGGPNSAFASRVAQVWGEWCLGLENYAANNRLHSLLTDGVSVSYGSLAQRQTLAEALLHHLYQEVDPSDF